MCILLWTLPTSNHPRFKFAFASNRDESITRETSRADFWDVESILNRATNPTKVSTNTAQAEPGSLPGNGNVDGSNGDKIGILSGQDKQPAQTENYVFKETETTATGEEKVTLMLSTEDVPGTWLGITTHGDLVGLTNYRETAEYLAQKRPPKLSRGKVCGEFLVTMAAARDGGAVANDRAEQWIKRRAIGWDTEFEGLNLLVVQNAGEQQCVGGNREGSELTVYNTPENAVISDHPRQSIEPGSVVGVSNSVFKRPWSKVHIGTQALEKTLNESISLFGAGPRASLQAQHRSNTHPHLASDDDTVELAWLVIEMLTLLRVNTKPFPKDISESASLVLGLRERVFIPLVHEYGTRSSTVVLFGRNNRLAVFVEKVWHGPPDETTGDRIEFAPDSTDGLLWLQGLVGQPRKEWKRIEGQELEDLVRSAKEAHKFNVDTQL
ncbi:hypothetical protein BGZ80_008320 [Entomortierella chlamydospora]|uniref:Duf833 domain-containing protein n=1 Tax=Entomortierella chlamydospora TaxID=101097 RepID=A0A9P6MYH3_9FUNG|nr:hypothetical protein BGZ80_008320 [Entomortierella chlamydospora]